MRRQRGKTVLTKFVMPLAGFDLSGCEKAAAKGHERKLLC